MKKRKPENVHHFFSLEIYMLESNAGGGGRTRSNMQKNYIRNVWKLAGILTATMASHRFCLYPPNLHLFLGYFQRVVWGYCNSATVASLIGVRSLSFPPLMFSSTALDSGTAAASAQTSHCNCCRF